MLDGRNLLTKHKKKARKVLKRALGLFVSFKTDIKVQFSIGEEKQEHPLISHPFKF